MFTPLNTEAQLQSSFDKKLLEIQRFNFLINNLTITKAQLERAEALIEQTVPSFGWTYLFSEEFSHGLQQGRFLEIFLLIISLIVGSTLCMCAKCGLDFIFKYCCPPVKYLLMCLLYPLKKCIDSYTQSDTRMQWPNFKNPFQRSRQHVQTRSLQLSQRTMRQANEPRSFEIVLHQPRNRFTNITEL